MKTEAVQPDKGGYWQVVEKTDWFFGGSAVCRLPFSLCFKKKCTPIEYQNSIRTGSFLLSVCCFFFCCIDFSVGRLFPLPSAFHVQTWKGKGFRAEYSPQEEDSDRNGLPLDLSTFKGYCTTFADEQRKWANDGIGKLIISQIYDRLNSNITLQ